MYCLYFIISNNIENKDLFVVIRNFSLSKLTEMLIRNNKLCFIFYFIFFNTQFLVKVDLDSVYEVDGKKVYQLQKTATEELNLFHLVIQISLADGRSTCLKSREFLLVGKKTAASG